MTTTRSDSDARLAQDPQTSRNGFSQDSPKVVSLPPLEKNDSVGEMMSSKKEVVKSPPLTSVLEKDEETIRSDSDETKAMDVECPEVFSVPETTSAFLEEDGIGKELQRVKEASAAKVSEGGDDVHEMEGVDGSVVCISEKKGQEDSDVQRLLEAEKNGNGSKEQHQKMERVRVKDNAFVGRSVNIDLVDDTALLNVVPFSTKAKDHHPKDAPRKHKKHIGGGKQQQDKGNASNVVEGNELKRIVYSISQMKSMRFANLANQTKLWSDIYTRLLPELVKEYEGLVSFKNQKTSKSNTRESRIGTKEGIDDLTLEEVGEEEYTEDNDDYISIFKPAFAVDGEPDFESGPPEDGFEYLRRVGWEAERVPNVKVAKIDGSNKYITKEQSVYMPQIPEFPKCPEHLLPLKEWEDSLLSDFSQLRMVLDETIPSTQSIEGVLMEIFSKRLHIVPDDSFSGLVSDIQGMDSVTRVSRLRKRICLVEKENGLESSDCKWVVALCASVDTPLDGDTCACLRALLRKCASVRALEVEDEQVVIMANMLITIAGRYFGQME